MMKKMLILFLLEMPLKNISASTEYFPNSNQHILKILEASDGKSISVVDFVNYEKNVTALSSFIELEVIKKIIKVKASDKLDVKVITRSKLEQIQKEKRKVDKAFVESNNNDLGIIQGADILITGNISDDGKYFKVSFEAIDVYSGEIIYIFDDKLLKEPDLEKLYSKISEKKPLYGGNSSSSNTESFEMDSKYPSPPSIIKADKFQCIYLDKLTIPSRLELSIGDALCDKSTSKLLIAYPGRNWDDFFYWLQPPNNRDHYTPPHESFSAAFKDRNYSLAFTLEKIKNKTDKNNVKYQLFVSNKTTLEE